MSVELPTRALAERALAEAFDAGALGVEEQERGGVTLLIVYLAPGMGEAVVAALAPLVAEGARLGPSESVPEADWSEAWKQGLKAIHVSERLLVRPSFIEQALAPGQRELVLDPGQAFGTGGHASTFLALEWIDALLAAPAARAAGWRVLDVGTGSGVLAMAAVALGARSAVGFDLDRIAVREAALWAKRNRLGGRLRLFAGPLAALASEPFELVVANLLRSELLPLAAELARQLRPGGQLVLSGLLAGDRPAVTAAFAAHGLAIRAERTQLDVAGDHWIAPLLAHVHSSA